MESEVPAFVPRNIITRSVGPTPEVEVDLEGPFSLRTGDVYLLCSDGLSGQIEDEEIGTILRCFDPDDAAHILVDLANLRGSPDNITVIIARVNRWSARNSQNDYARAQRQASLAGKVFRPVVAAAGLFAIGWMISGPGSAIAAALVGGLLTGIWSFRKRLPVMPDALGPLDRQRLGKAPYTTCDCTLNERSPDCMARAVQKIRDVAINRLWQVDWDHFETLNEEAKSASTEGDYDRSVRTYGELIRFFMSQLRNSLETEP